MVWSGSQPNVVGCLLEKWLMISLKSDVGTVMNDVPVSRIALEVNPE